MISNQEYLNSQYEVCPLCGSYNITSSDCNYDDNTITQDVCCKDCDASWDECYTLTGISNVKDKDGNEIEVTYD